MNKCDIGMSHTDDAIMISTSGFSTRVYKSGL